MSAILNALDRPQPFRICYDYSIFIWTFQPKLLKIYYYFVFFVENQPFKTYGQSLRNSHTSATLRRLLDNPSQFLVARWEHLTEHWSVISHYSSSKIKHVFLYLCIFWGFFVCFVNSCEIFIILPSNCSFLSVKLKYM